MKSEIEDLRCPTCRQRNSRVRKHLLVDGETALVWYCNVPGCSNGPDVPRQAADFHGVHAAELLESLPCAPDADAVRERVKQGGVPVPADVRMVAAVHTCDNCGDLPCSEAKKRRALVDHGACPCWKPNPTAAPANAFAPFQPPFRYVSGVIFDARDVRVLTCCVSICRSYDANDRIGHAIAAAMNKETK